MSLMASVIIVGLGLCLGGSVVWYWWRQTILVPEDSAVVTTDKNDFIKRVLPAGTHRLRPFEKIAFTLETKPKLVTGQATAVVTQDGISVNVNWSGVYALEPERIAEKRSQRLRGLANGDKAIGRSVDISLRQLIGAHVIQELFRPATREQVEQQLYSSLADRLQPLGIVLVGFNLQVLELPAAVRDAFNKAKAIEALDGTIRQLDPTTQEVMRRAYHLDELLHWEAYLPVPSRRKGLAATAD